MAVVDAAVRSGLLRPETIVAIMVGHLMMCQKHISPSACPLTCGAVHECPRPQGKTEGNGCVNDFSRGLATLCFADYLSKQLGISTQQVEQRVALIMSGGTEGGLCPHITVFCVEADEDSGDDLPSSSTPAGSNISSSVYNAASATTPPADRGMVPGDDGKRLALGVSFTRQLLPEELGRMAQVEQTAAAVRSAMADAGISDPADVHFVQIKCPLLTKLRMEAAATRRTGVVTQSTLTSMAYSRAASALGVAVALGELPDGTAISDADILSDWSLYSGVASTSAGIELERNEVLVLGNSSAWSGRLRIDHDVMADAIDVEAARRALSRLGVSSNGQLTAADREAVVCVLAKAEPPRAAMIRGRRHVMWDDSDISATRHARALVGGVLAGLIGDTCLYVSGGAEHQGPDGGGPVAVIARSDRDARVGSLS